MSRPWIGVDLDGTLAVYNGWQGGVIGLPIQIMVERVKEWLAEGKTVKIMTARVSGGDEEGRDVEAMRRQIEDWCEEHLGQRLEVTCCKDYYMVELWDDRAVGVIPNIGISTTDMIEFLKEELDKALDKLRSSEVG